MLRSSLWMTATEWWETIIRENEKLSVVRNLRKFHQLFPWMWRRDSGYFLCLWICILGRIETVLLWQAEGTACSWTSSTPRLRHKNAERWRRDRQWYRDISRRNASTAWRTISVFRKIFPFLWRWTYTQTSVFSGLLWLFILATSSGIPWRINWILDWKEITICMPFRAAFRAVFMIYTSYLIRFFLMDLSTQGYRRNWQKESNHQVWEW